MKRILAILVMILAFANIAISLYFALLRRNTSVSFTFCLIAMVFVFAFSAIGKKK